MSIIKNRVVAVAAGAAIVVTLGGGSAVAGSLITSAKIQDQTIRSVDIATGGVASSELRDGSVNPRDLSPATKRYIASFAGKDGVDGAPGAPGAPGTPGEDGDVAGVQTNWTTLNDAEILDKNSVLVAHNGGDGSAVQIENLNMPVQALQEISFTYKLSEGAVYGGGVPRVFVEISGEFFNTFDGDPADAGHDNGDGTFTKTVTIRKNGRIGQAGVVADSGVGSVTVSNLTIAGKVIEFK